MEYLEYYKEVWRKFAVFSGRANRSEFWYFVLINIIVVFLIGLIDSMAGSVLNNQRFGLFGSLYSLAVLIPSLAIGFRRLHDVGKSAWWYLIIFIPVVGFVVLIVFFAMQGEKGKNKYGPPSKFAPVTK